MPPLRVPEFLTGMIVLLAVFKKTGDWLTGLNPETAILLVTIAILLIIYIPLRNYFRVDSFIQREISRLENQIKRQEGYLLRLRKFSTDIEECLFKYDKVRPQIADVALQNLIHWKNQILYHNDLLHAYKEKVIRLETRREEIRLLKGVKRHIKKNMKLFGREPALNKEYRNFKKRFEKAEHLVTSKCDSSIAQIRKDLKTETRKNNLSNYEELLWQLMQSALGD